MIAFNSLQTRTLPLGSAAVDPGRRPRPIGAVRARLGFPSPAEDFEDDAIDLNQLLVRNEPATYFYRAAGHSMLQAGIRDGDILIVDRSLMPHDGDIVLATWDGNEPACKTLCVKAGHIELHSDQPPIVLARDASIELFVVTGVVRQIRRERCSHVRAR